jgi:hypothetical protein
VGTSILVECPSGCVDGTNTKVKELVSSE